MVNLHHFVGCSFWVITIPFIYALLGQPLSVKFSYGWVQVYGDDDCVLLVIFTTVCWPCLQTSDVFLCGWPVHGAWRSARTQRTNTGRTTHQAPAIHTLQAKDDKHKVKLSCSFT